MPDRPKDKDEDPLDSLADRLLADIQRGSDGPAPSSSRGGLDWIRSTLRTGGADSDPLIGSLFQDKYRILRRIGKGGFGAVYEAVDERGAKNRVALKVQLPGFTSSVTRREMFRNEAMRVTRLHHPNIVDWKSFDVTPDGGSYFVMELLDGIELSEELKREGVMKWERAMGLMLQILEALVAAHFLGKGQSILHLDLKPKNILLLPANETRPERIKVIDFGIGQFLGGDPPDSVPVSANATDVPSVPASVPVPKGTMTAVSTQNTAGFNERASKFSFEISRAYTAEYASPEQCGHIAFALGSAEEPVPLDGRSDLYSFGVIAYELLTGRLPWKAPHIRELWLSIHQETPILPWGEAESKVPPALRAFIERCLEKRRDDRFDDSRDALEALRRIANPARTWRLVAAAMLFVLVGGITAFYLFSAPDGDLQLQTNGKELATHHMGPDSPPWMVEVKADGGPLPARVAKNLVLATSDGQELSGWRVEPTADPERIRLRPTPEFVAGVSGREPFPRIHIQSKDGVWASRIFDLTWLGEGTRKNELRLGAQPILENTTPRVDPEGLLLELHFPALQVTDLDTALWSLTPAGGGKLELVGNGQKSGAGLRVRLAELAPGTSQLVLAGRDNSGAEHRIVVPIELHTQPLNVALHLGSEAASAERTWIPGETQLFFQREAARLKVSVNRASDVVCETSGLQGSTQPMDGRHYFSGSLAPWLTNATQAGRSYTLRLEVTDGVLHDINTTGARHRQTIDLPVEVIQAKEIQWTLTGDPPVPGFEALPSERATSAGRHRVLLQPTGLPAAGRYNVDVQVGGPDAKVTGPWQVQQALDITPYLPSSDTGLRDGLVSVRVATYMLDITDQRSPQSPISVQELELEIDRTPPDLRQLIPPLKVLKNEEDTWQLGFEYPPDPGSDLLLNWQFHLERTDVTLASGDALPVLDKNGQRSFHIDPLAVHGNPKALVDGAYQLIVDAVDRAGNRTRVADLTGEIARHGPRLQVLAPNQVGGDGTIDWSSLNKRLETIQLRVEDENGVQNVTCTVFRAGLLGGRGRGQEYKLEPLETVGDLWSWDFNPPPSWSRVSDVYLRFEASDRHGQVSTIPEHGPLLMPPVDEAYDSRIGDMLFVPGNADRSYVFKGRTSVLLENRCFQEAGLDPIWVAPGREKPGVAESAWGLEVPPGTLKPYYLSEREVTHQDFHAFLMDTSKGYASFENWNGGPKPTEERRMALVMLCSEADPDSPVVGIWQREARAYARYKGKRLPTLLELTYAIRGGPEHYRAQSWDAEDELQHNPDDPWCRIRGLSRGAEWTMSSVWMDERTGLPARPRDARDFLPNATPRRAQDGDYWILGTPSGYPARVGMDVRSDFAAVDRAAPEDWFDQRVGFRLAWDADKASEEQLRGRKEQNE